MKPVPVLATIVLVLFVSAAYFNPRDSLTLQKQQALTTELLRVQAELITRLSERLDRVEAALGLIEALPPQPARPAGETVEEARLRVLLRTLQEQLDRERAKH